MITVIVERVLHDSGMRVALKFPYDQEVVDLVRNAARCQMEQVACNAGIFLMIPDVVPVLLKILSKFAFVDYTALRKQDLASTVREDKKRTGATVSYKGTTGTA